ncbi:MAG: hypothetical protein ACRDV9_04005 [Acidimicrobiia bacterium]
MILAVFVLLAVALVSLVVGVQASQDPMVFVSIAASGIAGLLLAVAFLRSRPRDVAGTYAQAEGAPAMVDLTVAPPPATPQRSAPAPLPIPDYQDLEVAEILPLLSDLERDELRIVEAHESRTRAHPWILSRIQTLLDSPSAMPSGDEPSWSARDFPLERSITDPPDADELELLLEDDRQGSGESARAEFSDPPSMGALSPGSGAESGDVEWEDFPIADYEWLPAAEILPLLSYLEPDELEVVRRRELTEGARPEVVGRIDALLAPTAPTAPSGTAASTPQEAPALEAPLTPEPERSTFGRPSPVEEPAWIEEPVQIEEPAAVVPLEPEEELELPVPAASGRDQATTPIFAVEPVEQEPAVAPLPIAGYDELSIGELIRRLGSLGIDELQLVREYEKSHRARTTILVRIDTALARR